MVFSFAVLSLINLLVPIVWSAEITGRVLFAGKSNVTGILNLSQSEAGLVTIRGRISDLSPGFHGFHVHQYGDIFTDGCDSTGPHFNPLKVIFMPQIDLTFLIILHKL